MSCWAIHLAVGCAGTDPADLFEDAIAAYGRGDYATAVRLFRPLTKQDDAQAQAVLGFMYEQGRGVSQDYVQAHKWFNLAASRQTDEEKRNQAVNNRDILAGMMTPPK